MSSIYRSFFIAVLILSTGSVFSHNIKSDFITCPPDITINCCQDYKDTGLTGHPSSFNYNAFNYYTYADVVGIDECRVGTIKRTWTGHSLLGQFSCIQYIQMERTDIFSGNIKWPQDWSGSCDEEIPFEEPEYDKWFCDQVAHHFKDDTFRFDAGACFKILRQWTVIDWCVFEPNVSPVKGKWEYTQLIRIIDNTPPVIASCESITIKAKNDDCTANAVFTQSATDSNCGINSNLKWTFKLDLYSNGVTDSTITVYSSDPEISYNRLPTGKHTVRWSASDGCANSSHCTQKLTVEDGKPPTIIAYLFTVQNLIQGDDSLRLPAKHFVKKAFDNCSRDDKITFSFTPEKKDSFLTFKCQDIGLQFLRIYAFDEAGNSDYVFILTRIQVNGPCTNTFISGTIRDMNGNMMKDVSLLLEGGGAKYLIGSTDNLGSFSIPYKEQYIKPKLMFSAASSPDHRITRDDVILLKNYLLGKSELDPMQKFAADMNDDGKLTAQDLKLMLMQYLYPDSENGVINNAKFFLEVNTSEENTLKEIKFVDDFSEHLNIRCAVKGDLNWRREK